MLIDLSYASSYLEGNTYSYLDTEILIKYNEIKKEKARWETHWITKKRLNIWFIYKKELDFIKKIFLEIHTLLGDKLLSQNELWVIRNHSVEIWWSSYQPLDNKFQLGQEFEIFLEKLNKIKNPFEQSLFIMVFIPYFQLFSDVSKRVSRIIGKFTIDKTQFTSFESNPVRKEKIHNINFGNIWIKRCKFVAKYLDRELFIKLGKV